MNCELFDNLSFLLLGKDVLIELKKNLFTAQNEYAIVLQERCSALLDGLMVVSSHTLTSCEISIGICSLVVELQQLSNILEERLENFPDEDHCFVSCSAKGGGSGKSTRKSNSGTTVIKLLLERYCGNFKRFWENVESSWCRV